MQPPDKKPGFTGEETDRLFLQYAHLVHGIALRILDDPAAADDVVGEVFFRLVRTERRPEQPGRKYLAKAARNEALHMLKRSETRRIFVDALSRTPRDPHPEPGCDIELTEERNILRGLIDHLPPRCREVVQLVVCAGLTHREVAESCGIKIKAVEKQMTRANRMLYQMAARLGFASPARHALKSRRGGRGRVVGL